MKSKKEFLCSVVTLVILLSVLFSIPVNSSPPPYGPAIDEMYFVYTSDPVLALQAGTVDACEVYDPQDAVTLEAAGFHLSYASAPGCRGAAFNLDSRPFDDIVFRKALAHLIPIDEVIATYIAPFGRRIHAWMGPGYGEWTITSGLTEYDFNPTLAASMLDTAGYDVVGGYRTWPENDTALPQFNVRWATDVYGGESNPYFERLCDEMESLGFTVNRGPTILSDLLTRLFAGDFHISWLGTSHARSTPDGVPRFWRTGSALNFGKWSNSTADALMDIISTSLNKTEIIDAAHELMQLMSDAVPFVPFHEPVFCRAYDPDLIGLVTYPTLATPFTHFLWRWKQAPAGGAIKQAVDFHPYAFNPLTDVTYVHIWVGNYYDSGYTHGLQIYHPTTFEPLPWAADAVSIEGTPSGMKITIELRPGMYWHDGVEATAHDVVFCLEYHRDFSTLPRATMSQDLINATAVGNYTAVVYYNTTNLWKIYYLNDALLAAKHIWNPNVTRYGEPAGLSNIQPANSTYGVGDPLTFQPEQVPYPGREGELTCVVGTGPYIFRPGSYVLGEYTVLEANPNFHHRAIIGDFNLDNTIDEDDLWTFAASFIDYYKTDTLDRLADFDDDVDIDEDDLWTFADHFIDFYKP